MKIGVMILEGPYQHEAVDTAYHFIKAALARGHQIVGIFLYTDGVNNINKFISPPGERNISQRLDELGASGIDIVACTACCKFRGMKPDLKGGTRSPIRLGFPGGLPACRRPVCRFWRLSHEQSCHFAKESPLWKHIHRRSLSHHDGYRCV